MADRSEPLSFDMGARIDAWRSQLLDTTRRNRLISFKTGRGGGVALVRPDPGALWDRLLGGAALTFPWRRDLLDVEEPSEEASSKPAPRPDAEELRLCLDSPRLREDHLLTDLPDESLRQRLTRLALN